ncbi:30S ribosomal protein S8 [bacterium (Candidatus Gribaldobacteria) CG23_combo_of_CG06-09_8_20_14_all_37_87_8]|uniref:Small ribosomal subunit protein uS8 n=2 Tax=Candidatus Gribaldobacteria TaxID=2798536 RepID=A0A2G9ZHH0_9BACT|nr:MAG: 30S ribosomal protein S8 [Parcubacteria group bacterium CG1_02_37_13]PIP32020.1 MAG: 30S ribosomal protein S8 [bacterium (Candidatus Gribaldobacteria) CG23_combo_of_CG06-09_8_20_14_all_37_87_8]PIR90118.1 MAG: 30S ribosomal protein S8 [bacterium (Candidatus Gribaldobacteria) CG10_big_fil_rev_8_21_14_0_10_37_21]
MNDPITDMFNRIRNVQALQRKTVDIPCSNLKLGIIEVLKEKGLIDDFKKRGKKPHQIVRISLKYKEGIPCVEGFKRVSKPGQRIYKKSKEIKAVKNGYGIAIISTSKGLLSDTRARKERLGGEVMVEVW